MHVPPRPPEAPLRTPATHRDRTALRESMVRGHRNMSSNDDIPRRDWRLVLGYVLQLACSQSLGLDWRGTGRSAGAATTAESKVIPHTAGHIAGYFGTF